MDGKGDGPEKDFTAAPGELAADLCRKEANSQLDSKMPVSSCNSSLENYGAKAAKITGEYIDFGSETGTKDGRQQSDTAKEKAVAVPSREQIRSVFGELPGGPSGGSYPNHFVPDSVVRGNLQTSGQDPPKSTLIAEKAARGQEIDLPAGDVKGSIFVRQNAYMLADSNIPLKTSDLSICSALILSDGKKTYLAHVDGSESPESIQESLKGLNLDSEKLSVFLLPGKYADKSIDRINQALSGTAALDKLKVVKWDPTDKGMGPEQRRFITIHNGKIMRGNASLEQTF